MTEVYVDFDKMKPLTRDHFRKLKVGDKVYYVNDSDDLNTITADKHMNCHQNRVVYDATIIQITEHNIVMDCMPIIASVHGWPTFGKPKSHIETISFSDGCEKTLQWLYKTIEWEYVV